MKPNISSPSSDDAAEFTPECLRRAKLRIELKNVRDSSDSGDINMAEQLELGREFMRDFHETFQALAK